MSDDFNYDVFLSHSVKDKPVVRRLAERLRQNGLLAFSFGFRASDLGFLPPAACLSADAFGSDWAQLEAGTLRFRDPLNMERRFIPLRLDDAPVKGSLAQFLYINWLPGDGEQQYARLLAACCGDIDLSSTSEPSSLVQAQGRSLTAAKSIQPSVCQDAASTILRTFACEFRAFRGRSDHLKELVKLREQLSALPR